MDYCCVALQRQVTYTCEVHRDLSDCPDSLIVYLAEDGQFGIRVHDGGSSFVTIRYCPWCGTDLLNDLRRADDEHPATDRGDIQFRFSASLRIFGDALDHDSVSRVLGVNPTHVHRKGEPGPLGPRPSDMWIYSPSVDPDRPLEQHITTLWGQLRPHMGYLRDLKHQHRVDIFCGYRSSSDHAGFEVGYECLGLFADLEVPFGVSVIIA